MAHAKYRHYGCRIIDDITYKGLKTLFLENELLRIGLLLDKGADIFEFQYKPQDIDFLWKSPQGIVDPQRFTPTISHPTGAFLDSFHGGWQELLPGGGPVNYRGAEIGLHGEVTNLRWDYEIIADSPDEIAVLLSVECIRTPLKLERVMRLKRDNPTLFIHETLQNLSPEDLELMWGHHPTFGPPFLHQGLQLFIPAGTAEVSEPQFAASSIFEPGAELAWPHARAGKRELDLSKIPGPEAGFSELLYLTDLSSPWYAILDPQKRVGFGLAWEKEVFPYLWCWMVYGKAPGYPWWDRVYCLALEPWTSVPNTLSKAQERGTLMLLKGGGQVKAELSATIIDGIDSVNHIDLTGKIS